MSEQPAPPAHILTLRGVRKNFGATQALKGVDLSLERGRVHALIGENGAGKSTLMKTLSGAHSADAGEMMLEGQPYRPDGPLHARSLGVCMIYQELALALHLSVMENILLGVEPVRGPLLRWGEMRAVTRRALDEVGLDHVDPATLVETLSVAEQQLIEIARAVAFGCKVLVLDEPTSSLTQKDVRNLFALVNRLKAKGVAIVYISHALEEIEELCQTFTVMRDGETVGHGVVGEVSVPKIISMMVGRDVADLYPRSPRTPGEPILELASLAGTRLPRNASLTLRRGEVVGIAGLIGAGRTETLRALFGLEAVTGGTIKIKGRPAAPASPRVRWAQGLGLVSEDRKTEGLAQNLSIAENLTLSKLDGLGPWRFVRPSRQRAVAEPWIKLFPIKCQSADQPIEALSGGNQQKVAIARLLHHDCDVLLLDEPTRGIDVGSKAQIYAWIDKLSLGDPSTGKSPKAVLVVSSYLPELLGICDRIAVMSRGVLGEAKPVAEWNEHSLMLAAVGQG
ncbi:MAG: sugar ABC transporter ATP-binding protein [Burkholderiales bacterium]|nr:sugar ABC transporter ATP-binding protein [Opitutaceae bacterium]